MSDESNNNESVEALYSRLDHYLSTLGSDRSIMGVSELDGFLTAVGCAPDSHIPGDWLWAIWGPEDEQPNWESKEQEEEFLGLVMIMYMESVNGLIQGDLHPVYLEHTAPDGKVNIMIEDWCVGFMRGAHLLGLNYSADKAFIDEVMACVRLYGTEKGWQKLEGMTEEERQFWRSTLEESIMRLAQFHHPEIEVVPTGSRIVH
ncbi:UPF0149 family protein [Marinomonas mediterranea]|jgi:yecA family protein|uniref:YecA family protein n=1 Tax=Marinomonas mediterranea (strain ATCC 700492 / JCM 21426 / NBRC 103028 / MMB-1) TaxID=717774 RepID=F2K4A9_MARM1|nr:UPF0149 family protein [Marinomonas mediterranea]ADZ92550.1 yecA family protein [Marinomonas mediterranea MMB-1]WCN10495.1 UPF0149 family protein [Marinomonas mediterranea]WCN14544.1 UPF0149 family protein [Marinomonas mediterranea]WCN18595.1 UPF0149 family protein [Marinomonas mediterranea MMB-1]